MAGLLPPDGGEAQEGFRLAEEDRPEPDQEAPKHPRQ